MQADYLESKCGNREELLKSRDSEALKPKPGRKGMVWRAVVDWTGISGYKGRLHQ